MADLRWGTKRICLECSAAFYDMRRAPITCPKCATVHRPAAPAKAAKRPAPKSRGSWVRAPSGNGDQPVAAAGKPEPEEADMEADDVEEVAPVDEDTDDAVEPVEEER